MRTLRTALIFPIARRMLAPPKDGRVKTAFDAEGFIEQVGVATCLTDPPERVG